MDAILAIIIILLGFLLGACPFPVWIGQAVLHTDIRKYGDHNPGSMNVFRTGKVRWGIVALAIDLVKGMPAIFIARFLFALPQPVLYMAALAAVAGHAYSPFLGFKGGKALAVFGGTLLALYQWDILAALAVLLIIGALFFINDAWAVLIAMAGAIVYLLLIKADIWEFAFIGGVAVIFVFKQRPFLREIQYPRGRLMSWIRSRNKTA
jgi:acyl phosphate:glycerol-3-phosphate acyltransferase